MLVSKTTVSRSYLLGALVGCLATGFFVPGSEAADSNLLRLSQAKFLTCSDPWIPAEEITALADGDSLTACHLTIPKDLPVNLTYGFGGEIVSPGGLEVRLQVDEQSNSIVGQMELLGSIVSPEVGYQLLREEALYASNSVQAFTFLPAGAKWLVVRFKSYEDQSKLSVAEVGIIGNPGPPKTNYAFKQTPASALKVLGKIKQVSGEFALTPEETSLFQDAGDGKLDQWSFDEAMLLVSGAREKAARQSYLAKLSDLEKAARQALGSKPAALQAGDQLLQWMHTNVLTRGYESGQTDVTTVLDQGTFNCVSSAVLFNLLGRRLGLDARAVEVPDHAFSIVYQGLKHADVETTTPRGFNPARNPDVVKQFYQDTGFVYIPEEHKDQRREIKETGLMGVVYYNHGVSLIQQGKFQESLLAFFRALSLDSELFSAIHNALAALAIWSGSLAEGKQFPDALKVVGAGLELAPQDAGLNYAHKAIWFSWADSALDQNDSAKALDILRKAAKAVPDGNFEALQAWAFIRPSQDLAKNGQWKKAVTTAEKGLKQLPAPALAELNQWRTSLYFAWADAELDQKRFGQSLKVLEQAIKAFPEDRRFKGNQAYTVLQWTLELWKTKGLDQARKHLSKWAKRYQTNPEMRRAVTGFLGQVIVSLLSSKNFEQEALAAIEGFRAVVATDAEFQQLVEYVYDQAADQLLRQRKYAAAVDVYQRALKIYPNDRHLLHNADAVWDAWIGAQLRDGDFEGALKTCGQALQKATDPGHFQGKQAFLVQEYSEALYRSQGYTGAEDLLKRLRGQYPGNRELKDVVAGYIQRRLEEIKHLPDYQQKADEIIRRCKPLLEDEETGQKLELSVYDDRALKFTEEKNWEAAIKVYEEALRYYPDEEHVRHNAVASWDAWVKDCQERKDWKASMEVCSQGAKRSIDPAHFHNNLAYSGQQYAMETFKQQGVQKSAALLADLLRQYPQVKDLREAAKGHFQHVLEDLKNDDSKAYEQQGLAIVQLGQKALGDAEYGTDLYCRVYDKLAGKEEKAKEWERAIGWYNKALKKYPGNKHLTHNLVVTWDHWAQQYIDTKEWKKAIAIYEKARKAFPDDGMLKNNLGYCQEQMYKQK